MRDLDYKQVEDRIVNWIKDYAQKAGAKTLILGISGGIDSSVVSTLCAKTGMPTLLLQMPIHQIQSLSDKSEFHATWMKDNFPNVTVERTDLTTTLNAFLSAQPESDASEELLTLTEANTRSRIRMVHLYYTAATHGGMVIGTGNKVEDFGVGFYTKYGDGGVDISPIADLMKTEVYSLAKSMGIPSDISDKELNPPTDGLWDDGRTDEDQIGATYPELEWAMEQYENERTPADNDLSPRQREVLAIYNSFNRRNQHKMNPIPVCEIGDLVAFEPDTAG